MTKQEFDEMAALVVRLRDVTAGVEEVNDELTKALAANVDALVKSNAQCSDYHKRIERLTDDLSASNAERDTLHDYAEKLHTELIEVRAALAAVSAERDSLKRTLKEWEEAETTPHVRVAADDIADHVVPPAVPRCEVCHGCGSALVACSNSGLDCQNRSCNRTCTTDSRGGMSPWAGVCKQQHAVYTVRHE